MRKCASILETYNKAAENWFIKCKIQGWFDENFNTNFLFYLDGDLGAYADAEKALMKQKHRLVWERRHGPVGSGMKEQVINQ